MKKELFSDSYKGNPKIYAYSDSHPQYEGLLKKSRLASRRKS